MLGVGLLCVPLLGSAAAPRGSSGAGLIAASCEPDWGAPDWTLAVLATPASERVMDAQEAAQAALGPRGAPVSLLQPAGHALSQPVGSGILQAYAWIAGVRQPAPARPGPLWAARQVLGLRPADASHEAEIKQGARQSGVSPRYLFAVARAESGLSTYARARTSSAAGLFQFVDQTWLRTLRRYGPGLGLMSEAEAIRVGADGRARIADPAWRAEILALRYDPMVASRLAGALTRENASNLRLALGRTPTAGELYAAHLLGPGGALLLLSADRVAPAYSARALLPAAAASNRALFFAGAAPRSVHEVAALIADRASGGGEP